MPQLEVRLPDGRQDVRKLSRRNPIVIGRNPVSDIHVDDESVAAIHCRISWNGKAYEVADVSGEGVEVNGTLVQKKRLSTGDVIRIGELDVVMLNGSGEIKRSTVAATAGRPASAGVEDIELSAGPMELDDDDWEVLSAGEIEMPVVEPTSKSSSKRPKSERPTSPPVTPVDEPHDEPVLLNEAPAKAAPPADKAVERKASPPASTKSWGVLKPKKRPGEQDILTSPLVLGFGGLALALLLAAGAIWLLIGREGADRLFASAVADRDGGRYAQAIKGYEQFLLEYPTDSRAMEAKFALGLTRIERYAGGSAPDFEKALKEFDNFVRDNRDSKQFDTQREPLRNLARQIASGAAAEATRTGVRKLLKPAETGRTLFDRYAPADGTEDAVKAALAKAYTAAEIAVRKHEYFEVAATKIENAIAKNDFATAFATRSDLLTRYPDLKNDRRLRTLLASSLKAEQKLVQPIEPNSSRDNEVGGGESTPPLTLIGHTQARAGEVSDGRLVYAVGRDAVLGLDAVTGRPVWTSPIGLDTPFTPVEVNASVAALLAFDGSRNELVLLKRDDGTEIWRTSAGARATGPPLIAQGQIDLVTANAQLQRFDLETGRALATVAFPQNLVGAPVLAGERLIAFGESATAYTLNFRSLDVEAVSFVGQAAGALVAPPQALGRLIVTFENDRQKTAAVRAFAIDDASGVLRQVAAERVEGFIREPAVARGNVLFVPSSQERIFAFSVSDAAGQPPLKRLAGFQVPEAKDVPTFLVPGPEGMLWAAGSALRKLRLAPAGLELQQGALAPGRHTQPPQQSGESLFVARSLPSAAAVYISQADREAMTGSWRTVIGASIVGLAADDANVTLVTSAGQMIAISEQDLARGGFVDTRVLPQWDENAAEPLQGSVRIAADSLVWRDGKPPLAWRLRGGELPSAPRPLSTAPQCAPVRLEGGFVLPVAGRLEWLPDAAGAKVEAFLLPVAGDGTEPPRWQSLTAIDDERFVAADERGTLRVMRLRQEPAPHLSEAASITLAAPLVRAPVAIGERIAIAEGTRLSLLDPAGLRPVAEATFDRPVAGGPWAADAHVFVQTDDHQLFSLDGETLERSWNAPLAEPLADAPVRRQMNWIAALQSGVVLTIGDDGVPSPLVDVHAPLTVLLPIAARMTAVDLGGALHLVPETAGETPEAAIDRAAASAEGSN